MKTPRGVLRAAVVAMVVAAPALGAGDAPWSVESGKTVGAGRTVFWGQAGYPGIWLEFIHGVDPTLEIGGKFAFNYGFEGIVDLSTLGLDFQFLLRKAFYDNGKFRIAGRFDPGILLYFPSGDPVVFGIMFPIGVEFGFPVSSVVSINASFALPMYAVVSGGTGFVLPIMFGGGVEYLIERNLALTFKLALGPSIVIASGYVGGTAFTLNALFGAAYRFD